MWPVTSDRHASGFTHDPTTRTTMSFDGIQRCNVCRRAFDSAPVFRADTRYCCVSCADGRLCHCLTEIDAAGDGADGLGLAFGAARPSRLTERRATAVDRRAVAAAT